MTTEDAYDPTQGTVDDVKEHVEQHPEEAEAVLAAERDGKDRSTLTTWLEGVEAPRTVEPATPGVIKSPDPDHEGNYPTTTKPD